MMYHNYQPNPPPLTPNQQPSYNQNYYNFSNYNKSYQMPSNQNVTGNYYPPPDGTRPPDYSQMGKIDN